MLWASLRPKSIFPVPTPLPPFQVSIGEDTQNLRGAKHEFIARVGPYTQDVVRRWGWGVIRKIDLLSSPWHREVKFR